MAIIASTFCSHAQPPTSALLPPSNPPESARTLWAVRYDLPAAAKPHTPPRSRLVRSFVVTHVLGCWVLGVCVRWFFLKHTLTLRSRACMYVRTQYVRRSVQPPKQQQQQQPPREPKPHAARCTPCTPWVGPATSPPAPAR